MIYMIYFGFGLLFLSIYNQEIRDTMIGNNLLVKIAFSILLLIIWPFMAFLASIDKE